MILNNNISLFRCTKIFPELAASGYYGNREDIKSDARREIREKEEEGERFGESGVEYAVVRSE